MTMLSFNDVYRSFGDRRVLKGLTFQIESGEVYGLLGPNGAGKTTAINILCGLLDPDAGSVEIGGGPVTRDSRRVIGIAPQELSIYQDLTCRQNLKFFGQAFGLSGQAADQRTEELSSAFSLAEYLDVPGAQLSGGWKRRLNMAIALMHSPSLLILDEPTVGVDVEARYELWDLITKLRRAEVTIVLTTHHLDEAEALCNRVGIISQGRILAEGSLGELGKLVPGELVLVADSEAPEEVRSRGVQLGWSPRDYKGHLSFLLPHRITIAEAVGDLGHVPLTSLSIEEIGLEHVYFEVTSRQIETS